jgi:hypothetical protein
MGNALVMMIIPEEALPSATSRPSARYLEDLATQVAASVWEPPEEPRALGWHRDPELRREHNERVRQSLEAFCNERLAQLDGMVRTGWWILGRARVRVVEFEDVSDGPIE